MLIVKLGHKVIGKTGGTLKCRSDSKVAKTNVHYPTDLSLLWDATPCLIVLSLKWSSFFGLMGWRQNKNLFRTAIPTKFKTSHYSALWGLLFNVRFVNYFMNFR